MTATVAPERRVARGATSVLPTSASSTPRTLALVMVALALAAVVWGAFGAWTAASHSSAASDVLDTREPASLQARQMYQSLSDADITSTSAFLAGPNQGPAARQRYQADLAQASKSLSALRADSSGDPELSANLSTIATGLPTYAGYVSTAQSDQALGYQLTGGSFIQVASEEMHLTLLPAARQALGEVNASLAARSAQADGLPWIAGVLVLSLVIGFVLMRTQSWLSGRTRRTLNFGLLASTVLLAAVAVWLTVVGLGARSDFARARAHGSAAVQALANATIVAQRAHSDEILNLISRTGATSFQSDAWAAQKQMDSLLDQAIAATPVGVPGRSALKGDADAWYLAQDKVFSLDVSANYAAETQLVIGAGRGSSAAAFANLQRDISRVVAADQQTFVSGAQAGANAYRGLAVGFIVGALLMAGGCVWGLSRRLAEYR